MGVDAPGGSYVARAPRDAPARAARARPPPGGGADASRAEQQAVKATLHCLTGCAIGEVLGMVIGTALGWTRRDSRSRSCWRSSSATRSRCRRCCAPGSRCGTRLGVALAADTVSIAVMEIVDNAIMLSSRAPCTPASAKRLFWGSLAFALAVAFVLTVPVNRWLIAREGTRRGAPVPPLTSSDRSKAFSRRPRRRPSRLTTHPFVNEHGSHDQNVVVVGATALALSGCRGSDPLTAPPSPVGSSTQAQVTVAAAFYPYWFVAQRVGGDRRTSAC